jgi:hypothetical protein
MYVARGMNMDESERYIKMNQKALEIQNLWQPKVGDRTFTHRKNTINGIVSFDTDGHISILQECSCYPLTDTYNKTSIWIPRQDDLQAMIYTSRQDGEGFEYGLIDLWEDFEQFMNSDYPDGHYMNSTNKMDTFEQAWLLFVMLRKYNKIFDEHDWVVV